MIDVDKLKMKRLCYLCVGEDYLRNDIRMSGTLAKCFYCKRRCQAFSVGDIASRVATAFSQHYGRTSDQPNDYEYMLSRDRESSYDWDRHGEQVVYAIMNAADIPEAAAHDIQLILEDEFNDFSAAEIGEETEFASGSYYEERAVSDLNWQDDWDRFERSIKTSARFFSREAAMHLTAIFEGVAELQTMDGQPLIVDSGPRRTFSKLYRARVFQSDEQLEMALSRPDQHLGPPPSFLATSGRMNAVGISVFYGASDPMAAIAEVRPPVGSQVTVAEFKIIRKLRLLDLTALRMVKESGSIFDVGFSKRLERAQFLKSLSGRITRPVMPDDERFSYLATQAIADFLATETSVPIDGIIFPSVQVAGKALNVVLFHKAARVEGLDIPVGTKISAKTGQHSRDGWEDDYAVFEVIPSKPDIIEEHGNPSSISEVMPMGWRNGIDDDREPSLRINLKTISVHQIKGVSYRSSQHLVRRHRWQKRLEPF